MKLTEKKCNLYKILENIMNNKKITEKYQKNIKNVLTIILVSVRIKP